MTTWLRGLPKAELHLHIEGTLEPELMFALAERNGVTLPYDSVAAVRAAYDFDDLPSFLDLYYQGMGVLHTREDFFDLAMAYFARAQEDGVAHVELSFDPQAHLVRGVPLEVPFEGLLAACREAESRYDISSALIMSFLRDRDPAEALEVFEQAAPWHASIDAVGLDSAERDHPPGRFAEVFERARALGIPGVAHAGEEGPAAYIREAWEALEVCRIDHGVRCLEDPELVARLRDARVPLTVCPLSNVKLKVTPTLTEHPLPALREAGLNVTLNSDDPAYFGGGMLDNHVACHEAFGWTRDDFIAMTHNAVQAAFMDEGRREALLERLRGVASDV
ncbi:MULTISPECIES: adenosine deaminase [Chromohalobacter]|nr:MULTISPECIES: adenosine deaminase [Chromohalobacter]MCI0508835.1 adenosine deaminase [Chromohalobacter sp.]MCI0594308.1 adenosine deaminase [Chromohalobacter sp.]